MENPPGSLVGRDTGSTAKEVLDVSVIICAYTERRWEQTQAAVKSVMAQRPRPAQVILVVDHNGDLAAKARRALPEATVIESDGSPGLSGARNTGLKAASQPIAAFLDDDAEARPGWLASLIEPYLDINVVATGGSVYPRWPGSRPKWLPSTFDWVFGCSYTGLPTSSAVVRNPIGANMSMRTHQALAIGGFNDAIGRVNTRPAGCEETELSIRLGASCRQHIILYVPDAAVDHHVGPERLGHRYFLSRCWHEGRSKAVVVSLAGSSQGLKQERRQTAVVIPMSILRDAGRIVTGDIYAATRIIVTLSGLTATMTGYMMGRILTNVQKRSAGSKLSINGEPQASFINVSQRD